MCVLSTAIKYICAHICLYNTIALEQETIDIIYWYYKRQHCTGHVLQKDKYRYTDMYNSHMHACAYIHDMCVHINTTHTHMCEHT